MTLPFATRAARNARAISTNAALPLGIGLHTCLLRHSGWRLQLARTFVHWQGLSSQKPLKLSRSPWYLRRPKRMLSRCPHEEGRAENAHGRVPAYKEACAGHLPYVGK
jgi:hypothetical protein